MKNYYVNKNAQDNGDHEVHEEDCRYLPSYSNRKDLGKHANCKSAVTEAKRTYDNVDGCYHCSNSCHKK